MSDLEDARECIRKQLLAGQAPGVLGAGIDPTLESESKLVVFASDVGVAEEFLATLLKDKFKLVSLRSGPLAPAGGLRRPTAVRVFGIFSGLYRKLVSLVLGDAPAILPLDGHKGRLGCFVKLNNGIIMALTVGHVFRHRDLKNPQTNQVVYCPDIGGNCDSDSMGRASAFSSLKSARGESNAVDGALIDPIDIPSESTVKRAVIKEADLGSIEGKVAVNLAPGTDPGTILDTQGFIKYEVNDG
jgi:hypothetical protein